MKAKYGYIGSILFVNLSDGTVRAEDLSDTIEKLGLQDIL